MRQKIYQYFEDKILKTGIENSHTIEEVLPKASSYFLEYLQEVQDEAKAASNNPESSTENVEDTPGDDDEQNAKVDATEKPEIRDNWLKVVKFAGQHLSKTPAST